MCLPAAPLAIASAGLTAASTVGSWIAQKQQAKAQNAAFTQNAINANRDAEMQRVQLTRRRVDELSAIGQQVHAINSDAADAQGQAAVSAAEGGISGAAAQDVADQIERQRLRAIGVQEANADTINIDGAFQAGGLEAQRQTRINSVERGQEPGVLGLVLGLAKAGIGASDRLGAWHQQDALLKRQTTVIPKGGTASKFTK